MEKHRSLEFVSSHNNKRKERREMVNMTATVSINKFKLTQQQQLLKCDCEQWTQFSKVGSCENIFWLSTILKTPVEKKNAVWTFVLCVYCSLEIVFKSHWVKVWCFLFSYSYLFRPSLCSFSISHQDWMLVVSLRTPFPLNRIHSVSMQKSAKFRWCWKFPLFVLIFRAGKIEKQLI